MNIRWITVLGLLACEDEDPKVIDDNELIITDGDGDGYGHLSRVWSQCFFGSLVVKV